MIPHHITPSYKLFQLYIDKGNINAAIDMGNYLLKQPIKKKGTKALRMEAEILEFLHKEKEYKENTISIYHSTSQLSHICHL